MPSIDELKSTIRTLMAEEFEIDEAKITDNFKFDDFDIDSLTAAQLIAAIEDEFLITLDDEEAMSIDSFEKLVSVVAKGIENA